MFCLSGVGSSRLVDRSGMTGNVDGMELMSLPFLFSLPFVFCVLYED
jgi:hypothetical protein